MLLGKRKHSRISKLVFISIYKLSKIIMHAIIFSIKNEYIRSIHILCTINTTTYLCFELLFNLS